MYKFFFLLVTCITVVHGWAGFNREQSINQHENKVLGVNCSSLFPDQNYQYYKNCFELGGKCYCRLNTRENSGTDSWEGKQRLCSQENMTILAIETPEEDKLIYDYFQKHHDLLYNEPLHLTAGKYSEINQRWEWISEWRDGIPDQTTTTTLAPPTPGKPMTYTNWYPGQPSNVEDGNRCLGLLFNYGIPYEGGYWDDFDCNYYDFDMDGSMFICESID